MERYTPNQYAQKLCEAVNAYDYPQVTYDFTVGREIRHPDMRGVEEVIRKQLISKNLEEVKDGLSNVLYWGMYGMGFRDRRVCIFRVDVTSDKLKKFSDVVDGLSENNAGLRKIANVGLPQFSKMSFVSKIRMFIDPDNYPILDKKIAGFANSEWFPPLKYLKLDKTTIRITEHNEQMYEAWASWCRKTAKAVNAELSSQRKDLRAVDVERGIFTLADSNKMKEAWRLLQGPQA